ncbi:MAG TPA: aminomethyltransferase family protein [Candidatus Polarisedimenticolia bacterium]|jgi:aminomethyltransferase
MPVPSPFHPRTSALCTSLFWKDWAGYHAVRSYDTTIDREYFSIRHAAGLIDVTPLYKYEVYGPDAGALLSLVMVKEVRKLKVGRVTYLCWCDDDGKVADDGTVSRLEEDYYRVTAAEPALAWLTRHAARFRVTIEDSSTRLAALSLQGPTSRDILRRVSDAPLDKLRYFGVTRARLEGAQVWISRTGYTGDLGYEVWMERDDALPVYDAIMAAGRDYRIEPLGLDAMDVSRVEAGYIMNGVDYFSAHHCLIESRKSTPFEINLGRTVDLERDPFIGQAALKAEAARGSTWKLVGLVYDWDEYEALFARFGLPPQVPSGAWRTPVPVYDATGHQAGMATSGAWSATLKQNLALAHVHAPYGAAGTRLRIEVTAEYQRHQVTATVTELPFFNPERKRA